MQHDLALNLGMSVAQIKRMSEKELHRWQIYAARYMLPTRRMELHMAQIALWTARQAGAEDVTIHDFLFDPPEEVSPEDAFANDAEALGFAPR